MLSPSNCYVAVRSIDGSGCPVVGGAWSARAESGGWCTLRRSTDGVRILSWRANSIGGDWQFGLFGPKSVLEEIAAAVPQCAPAREVYAAAIAGNLQARAFVRRWPIWRMTGAVRVDPTDGSGSILTPVTDEVIRILPTGAQLPAWGTAFPWRIDAAGAIVATDAAAAVRVDSLARPAILSAFAGYALHQVLEDEAPRS